LHRRAATWCEENGLATSAIGHAMEADDGDTIARLVASVGRESYAAGMMEKTFSWIGWFETQGTLDKYPSIAVLGAWLFALSGDPERATRWADSVTDAHGNVPGVPDEIGAVATLLRALLCADGPAAMGTEAATAARRLSGSPWYSAALLLMGVAAVLQDRFEDADTLLARSAEVGAQLDAAPAACIALAQQAALAVDRQDWDDADALVARALALIADHQLDGYSTSALAYAVGCRTAMHRGDIEAARRLLTQAAIIRPRLSWAIPHLSIQALLEQAHAYIEMSDVAGARRVVREASAILAVRPDLGTLTDRLATLKTHLATLPVGKVGVSSLTSAELRLLPLLVTHFTFREIGERLFVSRHTVKTQAMSIYRKLGASSRSDAVATARETGLLTS
jgi:LuxR family maltose regulon positive regulatory protein